MREQVYFSFGAVGGNSKHAYIDALLDHPSVLVLLEVDEHRHSDRGEVCELARMHDTTTALRVTKAETRPIAWVRFNPDETDGIKKGTRAAWKRRCGLAIAAIRELFANPRDDIVYVNYV